MIKIGRMPPPKNTVLDKKKEEALQQIRNELSDKKFTQKSCSALWRDPKVKSFIYNSQHKKCCYCERKRDCGESDVEHFRPKAQVANCPEHSGYWWLAYDWNNLLIACKKCNAKKSSQFPLQDETKRAYSEKDSIDQELPLLVNPLNEDPESLIEYDTHNSLMVKAIGKCERSKKTVDHLTGINSKEAVEERFEKLEVLRDAVCLFKFSGDRKRLERHLSPKSSFSGFSRYYLKSQGVVC